MPCLGACHAEGGLLGVGARDRGWSCQGQVQGVWVLAGRPIASLIGKLTVNIWQAEEVPRSKVYPIAFAESETPTDPKPDTPNHRYVGRLASFPLSLSRSKDS